jgi:hypothetical protein
VVKISGWSSGQVYRRPTFRKVQGRCTRILAARVPGRVKLVARVNCRSIDSQFLARFKLGTRILEARLPGSKTGGQG